MKYRKFSPRTISIIRNEKESILLPKNIQKRININEETECWEWTGSLAQKYGQTTLNGKIVMAHRAVYELLIGPIKENYLLHHICFNESCVNPFHMKEMTTKEHARIHNYFSRSPRCEHGHKATNFIINNKNYCRSCAKLGLL